MLGQPALGLGVLGLAGGQGGAGAINGQFEVGDLQAHQQVTLVHVLVVVDPDLVDACAELAGNAGDFTLHVGVVGAFVEAALEIPLGHEGEGDDGHQGEEDRQAAFELGRHETIVPEM